MKEEETWTRKAFEEAVRMGNSSNYVQRIQMMMRQLGLEKPAELEDRLQEYAAETTNKEVKRCRATSVAIRRVTEVEPFRKTPLFRQTAMSKNFHEFITMNAGLGNRKALEGRHRMLSCELCGDPSTALNEIHVLFECTYLKQARDQTGIKAFIQTMTGKTNSVMYREFWNNTGTIAVLEQRITAAVDMKTEYLQQLHAQASTGIGNRKNMTKKAGEATEQNINMSAG